LRVRGGTNNASDGTLISGWDSPEAHNLWLESCGVLVTLVAADIIGAVTGIHDLLDKSECQADTTAAVSDIAELTIQDLAPLLTSEPRPNLDEVASTLVSEGTDALQDLLPVVACDSGSELWKIIADDADPLLKALSVASSGGNLINTVGSSMEVEPWQGAYIQVGIPSWSAPAVTTAATEVTSSSAVLNGTVDPGGSNGEIYFQYTTDPSFVENVHNTVIASVEPNDSPQRFSSEATGLSSATTYYYRLVFYNSGNGETTNGNIVSFNTLAN
jgi:hypothetical protein